MFKTISHKENATMATLPYASHGDTLPVVKIAPKYKGKGDNRHIIGAEVTTILTFDSCAPVPIVIEGFDASKLPAQSIVNEHNMKLSFIMAQFRDLVINYRGGDFGSVIYSGTASSVEVMNSAPQNDAPQEPRGLKLGSSK